MNKEWEYDQIVFAHGTSPFTAERMARNNVGITDAPTTVPEQYEACWQVGMEDISKKTACAAPTKPPCAVAAASGGGDSGCC